MTNVSWILALGGTKCRILPGLEAPGDPLEAGSDECLDYLGSGKLKVSYSTVFGGWKSLELEVWSSDLRSSRFGYLEVFGSLEV